jgi:hypothetical protein
MEQLPESLFIATGYLSEKLLFIIHKITNQIL